jgi:hypothetical protein
VSVASPRPAFRARSHPTGREAGRQLPLVRAEFHRTAERLE